jgi:hypothetical protein
MDDLFSRGPATIIRIGSGRFLVRATRSGRSMVLDASAATVLSHCTRFDSLAGHASTLAVKLQLSGSARDALRGMLEEFASAGLLVSWAEFTAGEATGHMPAQLEWIAVPTRDRPEGLARCLRSHLEHARQFDRRIGGAVVDGSSDPDIQTKNRAIAAGLAEEFGCPVGYAGQKQKRSFAAGLSRLAGVPVELVQFALLDVHGCGHDAGANRNALLLGLAGRAFVSSDDDVICSPAVPNRCGPGLAFTHAADPTVVMLFANEAEAAQTGRAAEDDLYRCHEALLGRGTADLLRDSSPDLVQVSDADGSLAGALTNPGSRVAVTSTGLLGDSGALYPSFYAWSRPNIRDDLIENEARYSDLLLSRQIVRAANRNTVAGGAFFMSTHAALDNTQLLPPFLPVLRGQDLSFGRMLRLTSNLQFIAHVARTIVHRPLEVRRARPDALWPRDRSFSFASMFGAALSRIQGCCTFARPGEPRLRLIGLHLQELLSAEVTERERVIREELWRLSERQLQAWNEDLANAHHAESQWGRHLRAMLHDRLSVTRDADPLVPADLRERMPASEARAKSDLVLRGYAELLPAWSAIRDAAARLDPLAGGLFELA